MTPYIQYTESPGKSGAKIDKKTPPLLRILGFRHPKTPHIFPVYSLTRNGAPNVMHNQFRIQEGGTTIGYKGINYWVPDSHPVGWILKRVL